MEIITIFADRLYSFKYQKRGKDEYARIFRDWSDPELLFDFFEENKNDLQSGFYKTITVEEAVMKTIEEAIELENKLLVCGTGKNNCALNLFFKNDLHRKSPFKELIPKKGYGTVRESWLRLYAIEISKECYIITGGAIKLTRAMQDRIHTARELSKVGKCLNFLKNEGIIDLEGVLETIEIES